MALFESYERREKQILAVLKEYGIDSIEGAAEVTKAAGLDVYREKGCSRRCQIGKILCRDRNSEKFIGNIKRHQQSVEKRHIRIHSLAHGTAHQ